MNTGLPILAQGFSPFDLRDLPHLKQMLRTSLFGTQILGSQLGGLLVSLAASIQKTLVLKSFGGLKFFATTYLADIVVVQGKFGIAADDVYRIVNLGQQQDGDSIAAQELRGTTMQIADDDNGQFWQVYSNPASRWLLEFDDEKTLYFRPRNISISQKALQAFPSITYDEYKAIVNDFVTEHLANDLHVTARELIDSEPIESLHWAWYRFLTDSCGLSNVQAWGLHRAQRTVSHFERKAQELGFSSTAIEKYATLLIQSQRKKKKTRPPETLDAKPPVGVDSPAPPIPTNLCLSLGSQASAPAPIPPNLREIVIETVARLSDEQLRQLVLPIGPFLDALNSKRI